MAEGVLSYDNVTRKSLETLSGKVVLLGREYNLPQNNDDFISDLQSRIWCTYRKNFRPISGSHITSDTGWGCTLRCGQMLLAQAAVCKHLGRDWRWPSGQDDPLYMKILAQFLDTSSSNYSLHLIALQGVDMGRPLGHWFGPNNVAQVIKKLSVHDDLNQLTVHVAMDMLVVMDDVVAGCREPYKYPSGVEFTLETKGVASPDHLVTMHAYVTKQGTSSHEHNSQIVNSNRSVLLLIPLRLGQECLNPEYCKGLKACFDLPQSVGIIGGRPRHALWFIGYRGDHLIYLDPHTTQPTVKPQNILHMPDTSYHCHAPSHMKIGDIDPSVALGFFCHNETEFVDLCAALKSKVLSHTPAMFEIVKERPVFWDSCTEQEFLGSSKESYLLLDTNVDHSNEDDSESFEIIEWPSH